MPDAADKLSDDESEEARTLSLWRQPLVHICKCAVLQNISSDTYEQTEAVTLVSL